uniref:Silicon transporter n=1 Tax=Cylindrotheca fusiformis TaxID=2853 RepID=O81202_CYLFU|nr:silicon transporter [Cylindrotheca fusiformis]
MPSGFQYFQQAYSMCLVIFSVVIVTALMFTDNTKLAKDAHPVAALVIMWLGILWMSMVEGGQCSMVGLPPIDRDLYKESHPTTYKICSLGHKGNNLDRYLMGRQFMVIFINFTINLCGAPLEGAEVLGLPEILTDIFLGSGIAMVLTVVTIGQLTAQVNASHCMLDYINTHFMTFTLYVTLIIEVTGVMHSCYLIRDMFYFAAGKPVETNEPPRNAVQNLFHWGRVVFSLGVLCFALAVTLEALFKGQTTMWEFIPNGVAVVLFVLLMSLVGLLEGMQIAFFAVAKIPKADRGDHPFARKTCELLFKGNGRNLPGFMVGRQMTVTLCFFIIARVTTLDIEIGVDDNIFGVSDGIQEFFNLGFLGAIITTILASIAWQLVASAFPIAFLSNPVVYIVLRIVLLIEATGICAGAWFLGMIHKKVAGFQLDEVYVGTAEERAAGLKPDHSIHAGRDFTMGTNVLSKPPANWEEALANLSPLAESFSQRRERILTNIKDMKLLLKNATSDDEKNAYEAGIKYELKAMAKLNDEEQETLSDIDPKMEDIETAA